jgi:hypothetical protein
MFFWFQEEESSGDEEFVRKVNESLNGSDEAEAASTQQQQSQGGEEEEGGAGGDKDNANAGGSAQGGGGEGGQDASKPLDDRKNEDNNNADKDNTKDDGAVPMDDITTHPITTDDDKMPTGIDTIDTNFFDGRQGKKNIKGKDGNAHYLADLQNGEASGSHGTYTSPLKTPEEGGMGVSQSDLAAALLAATATSIQNTGRSGPSLSEVLNTDTIIPLLKNKEIQERLAEYLPEEHRHESAILELAASPQFQQQLEAFSEALQSGQLNLSAFGIPHNALTVADFLRSIESISSQEEGNKDSKAEKNKKVKR